jgi:GNAT superfamily N-acetyltransferase
MNWNEIAYRVGNALDLDEVIDVYHSSGLGLRRPVEDRPCMQRMFAEASLVVSAWDGDRLVGIARTLTDFCYIAYLADLLVRAEYQKRGIGRELIRKTRDELGAKASIVLLAAPAAEKYYPRLGFSKHPQAWMLAPEDQLAGAAND